MAIPAGIAGLVVSQLTEHQHLPNEESCFWKYKPAVSGLSSGISYPSFCSFSVPHRAELSLSRKVQWSLLATASSLDSSVQLQGYGLATSDKKKNPTKYYFLVANAKFMLDEEEHFQELMRERLRNFGERGKEQNFWLVVEPQFLDNFPDITKRLKRPAVALVSTDAVWITFMKLRLDRVLKGEIEAESLDEALRSHSVELNFDKPEIWSAPYSKYDSGWWTPFLPPFSQ